MSRIWGYLNLESSLQYSEKAKSLGMTTGELTQKLIYIFLNIQNNTVEPKDCLNCRFYQMSQNDMLKYVEVIKDLEKLVRLQKLNKIFGF